MMWHHVNDAQIYGRVWLSFILIMTSIRNNSNMSTLISCSPTSSESSDSWRWLAPSCSVTALPQSRGNWLSFSRLWTIHGYVHPSEDSATKYYLALDMLNVPAGSNLPIPPKEKFCDFCRLLLCTAIFKEGNNVAVECFIVKILIDDTPRGTARQSKSQLETKSATVCGVSNLLTCTAVYTIAWGATDFIPIREATWARLRLSLGPFWRFRGSVEVDAPASSSVSSGIVSESVELGDVKTCLKACRKAKSHYRRRFTTNLHQEGILEEPLNRIFGIITLVLVKEVWPTVGGHQVIGVKTTDVCSVPAVTELMSGHDIQGEIVGKRAGD